MSKNLIVSKINLALLLLFPIVLYSGYSHANGAARTKITVYKYDGADNAELNKYFSQFKGIIKRRVSQISSDLSDPSRGKDFKYLSNLEVIESKNKAGSIGKLENTWKNTNALQLLSGVVFDQGQSATVMSEVYLGLLPDYLKKSLVDVQLSITPEEYLKTRDIYSALTLYSILLDALKKQPPYVTSYYLGVTKTYVNDLDDKAPLTIELKKALAKVEAALKNQTTPQPVTGGSQ